MTSAVHHPFDRKINVGVRKKYIHRSTLVVSYDDTALSVDQNTNDAIPCAAGSACNTKATRRALHTLHPISTMRIKIIFLKSDKRESRCRRRFPACHYPLLNPQAHCMSSKSFQSVSTMWSWSSGVVQTDLIQDMLRQKRTKSQFRSK